MDSRNIWEIQTLTPALSGSKNRFWNIWKRGEEQEIKRQFASMIGKAGSYRLMNAQLKEVARIAIEGLGVEKMQLEISGCDELRERIAQALMHLINAHEATSGDVQQEIRRAIVCLQEAKERFE
jgi:hypothetical protein